MAHHSVYLDLETAFSPPRHCPACRALDLAPLCERRGLVFRCTSCSRSWVSELGTLVPAPAPRTARRPAAAGPRGSRAVS